MAIDGVTSSVNPINSMQQIQPSAPINNSTITIEIPQNQEGEKALKKILQMIGAELIKSVKRSQERIQKTMREARKAAK